MPIWAVPVATISLVYPSIEIGVHVGKRRLHPAQISAKLRIHSTDY
jgi:hypothetical protein